MWSFIKNLFKKEEKKEWLEPLFDHIEVVKQKKLVVPFKIVDIKKNGFLVKIEGLFAFLPFSLMPWKYQNYDNWNAVLYSLKKRVFHGTIAKVIRKEGNTGVNRIYVDASVTKYEKPELVEGENYKGVIIQKADYGLIVDIGHNFKWKNGSIRGLLHRSYIPNFEFQTNYETGKIIEVKLYENNDKGLSFKLSSYNYALESFVGKIVQARVIKTDNKPISYMVDEKYHAQMPMKNVYGDDIYLIRNMLKYLSDGEIIDCTVLDFNAEIGYLTLKFLPKNNTGLDWNSEEIQNYIGKTVQTNVYKSPYYGPTLLVENKYRAMITNEMPTRKKILNQMRDGTIIDASIVSVDAEMGIFIVDLKSFKPKRKRNRKHKKRRRTEHNFTYDFNAEKTQDEILV